MHDGHGSPGHAAESISAEIDFWPIAGHFTVHFMGVCWTMSLALSRVNPRITVERT